MGADVVRVLFVCMGNICRSPTAEGVFRALVESAGLAHAIESGSAGTHAYHLGNGADPRSTVAAGRRGYDLSTHRARRVQSSDFREFDYVLAMDHDNMRHLETIAPHAGAERRAELRMFLSFAPTVKFDEVPDPYERGDEGFEMVLDMVESASQALLDHIRATNLDV
ncbi:MAG: low molecular weight protein-tyrosine-phosphatase [Vicinamibacterales bacterium]